MRNLTLATLVALCAAPFAAIHAATFDYALVPALVSPGGELFLRMTTLPVNGCAVPLSGASPLTRVGSSLHVRAEVTDVVECHVAATTQTYSLGQLPVGVTEVAIYECSGFVPPGADQCPQQPARVFDLTQQGIAASIPALSLDGAGLLIAAMLAMLLMCRART